MKNGTVRVGVFAAAALLGIAGLAASAGAQNVQTINYSNFNSVTGLTLNGGPNGVPGQTPGVLPTDPMTLSITGPTRATAGSAYFTTPQRVDQGFQTDFHFRIRDRSGVGSDGLTFIVQNQGLSALGDTGGAIGFGTNTAFHTTGGITNSLAIVFDVWDNSADWDTIPGANVLTVQTSRFGPTAPNTPWSDDSIGATPVAGAFNDGVIHSVRIIYTPGILDVYYDQTVTPNLHLLNVNLANALNLTGGQNAYVGFTAATGALVNVERHEILDWTFQRPIPSPAGAGVLGLGALGAARRRRRAA